MMSSRRGFLSTNLLKILEVEEEATMPGISFIIKLQIIIRIMGEEEVSTNQIKIITGVKVELVNGDRPNNGEGTTTIHGEMQISGGNQIKVGWVV